MSLKQDLKDALALIEDPDRWVQGRLGSPSKHAPHAMAISGNDPAANCWCAVGAIEKVVFPPNVSTFRAVPQDLSDREDAMLTILNDTAGEVFPHPEGALGDIVWVNDTLGHDSVVEVFQKAIEDAPA